jgi:hypothetical protein
VDRPALPRAPGDALGPTGEPRLGAYQGSLGRVDLAPLAPEGLLASVRHAARLKRWQRVVLTTPDHVLALAILDAGTLAGGAVWVAERRRGEVLFARAAGGVPALNVRIGPHPGPGARASFAAPGVELLLERRSDRFQLEADLGSSLQLEAYLDARDEPEPFALVAPLAEGGVRATQITGPLEVTGSLSVRGRPHAISGGLAAIDFGAGLFPREVAWRKLTAAGRLPDGRALALHLAEGLDGVEPGDGGEDVLLVGGGPHRLPPVVFEADPGSPTAPWRVASLDGAVELAFRPAASHRDARELLVVSARTAQHAGELTGRLPAPGGGELLVEGLPGLVEDFAARW